jgi:hypothetical protein
MTGTRRGEKTSGAGFGLATASWLLAGLLLGGCAGPGASRSSGDSIATQTVWRVRDQYVRVEPRDDAGEPAAVPNDQPAELSPAAIDAFLAGLRVCSGSSAESSALLAADQREVLSRELPEAFRRAGPWQDVTFAVLGVKSILWGLGRSPAVTAGRMFVQGGGLNLILGDVQKAVDEYSGRPVEPFVPGSRRAPLAGGWSLVLDEGSTANRRVALVRHDWVRADLETAVAAPPSAAQVPTAPATPPTKAAPESPAQPPTSAQRRPLPAPAAQPPASPPAASPPREPTGEALASPGSERAREGLEAVQQRLWVLEELRRKGLITPEEYRASRARILEDL